MQVRNGFLKKAGTDSSGFAYRWVHAVSKIHTKAKMSVQQKIFPIFSSPGNADVGYKNLDFEKAVLCRTTFRFYAEEKFPTSKKLAPEARQNKLQF